jgi:hypothetical protein
MGFFSDFANQGFKHASFVDSSNPIGAPKTPATTDQDGTDSYSRVDRLKIENLYLKDAQTFNTINTYKQVLLQTGYNIIAEKKGAQSQYDKFFEEMGIVGMNIKLEQLLDRLIHDTCLYGYAYVEKVYQGDRIVDLKPVDAKLMDYARNTKNQIVVNSAQNPVGYTMKVGIPGGERPIDGVNGKVSLNHGQWFIPAEKIACFILYPYGNGFESMGLIEPAFHAIERKIKIETAIANNIHNSAASHFIGIVGDSQQKASKQLMQATNTALSNLSYNRVATFAHPTKVESLNVQHSPQADEFMRYLRTEQSAASGLALGFAVGSGEAVNRQTLSNQREFMDMRMDSIAFYIAEQFNTKILDALYKVNRYGSKAKLVWNEICTQDKLEKTNLLMSAIQSGVIIPEEVRSYILHAFDLKPNEVEYKKAKTEKKKLEKAMQNKPQEDEEEDTTNKE